MKFRSEMERAVDENRIGVLEEEDEPFCPFCMCSAGGRMEREEEMIWHPGNEF